MATGTESSGGTLAPPHRPTILFETRSIFNHRGFKMTFFLFFALLDLARAP